MTIRKLVGKIKINSEAMSRAPAPEDIAVDLKTGPDVKNRRQRTDSGIRKAECGSRKIENGLLTTFNVGGEKHKVYHGRTRIITEKANL